MAAGEIITKATVWISIVAYVAAVAIFAASRRKLNWDAAARGAYAVACLTLLAHVAFAFQIYHGWSHAAAYLDTARQTNEVVGISWGGGLYVNYIVILFWVLDVARWWREGVDSYRRRSKLVIVTWHAFLIFIIFNATVVFGHGAARWAGLLVSVCLSGTGLLIVSDSRSGEMSARKGREGFS